MTMGETPDAEYLYIRAGSNLQSLAGRTLSQCCVSWSCLSPHLWKHLRLENILFIPSTSLFSEQRLSVCLRILVIALFPLQWFNLELKFKGFPSSACVCVCLFFLCFFNRSLKMKSSHSLVLWVDCCRLTRPERLWSQLLPNADFAFLHRCDSELPSVRSSCIVLSVTLHL